jgi:hypothetical protein
MEDWWRYKDPEDLTPEERIQRIIELMAIASLRLLAEQRKEEPDIKKDLNPHS